MDRSDTKLSLRPAADADEAFLFELYQSSRMDEVSAFGWSEEQQTKFLQMQFNARQQAYKIQYPSAEDKIILAENCPVGRLMIDGSEDAMVIVDIAVAPEYRRHGIASRIIKSLQSESLPTAGRIVLRVDKNNRVAYELYRKQGFVVENENQILYSMVWNPDGKEKP